MKLYRKLKKKPFCNRLYIFLIGTALFFLTLRYRIFLLALGGYLLYLFKYKKELFVMIGLLVLLGVRLCFIQNKSLPYKELYICKIEDITADGYFIKTDGIRLKVKDTAFCFKPGDIVQCKIELRKIEKKSYETDFDTALYLKSKGIFGTAKWSETVKIKSGASVKLLKYYALNHLQKELSECSYSYVRTMVFADNQLEDSLKEGYSALGISHILAISGLHMILLYKILCFFLLRIVHSYNAYIPLSLLTVYTAVIGFPPACMRALLFLILSFFNGKGEKQYSRLDIITLSFLLMLLINPYQFYNSGFILSYLVSLLLIGMTRIIPNSGLLGRYMSFYLIYFVTLPIVAGFQHSISLYALLFSPVLGNFVAYILLPISYFLCLFPFFDFIFQYVYIFLNMYILGLYAGAPMIAIPSFSVCSMICYYTLYALLWLALIKKKHTKKLLFLFFFYLLLFLNIKWAYPFHKITFIDVGQGDSTLIELSHRQGIMLIDAFNCIEYLKSTGLTRIDYLILTHSDQDHIQDAVEIMEEFDVRALCFSSYDHGFQQYSGMKISSGVQLHLGRYGIDVLAPIQAYADTNSNSVVLKLSLEAHSFLFCGDMTEEEESDVIKKYGRAIQSEVLKVGHHGSRTSTSEEFLKLVCPSYSVISVGQNNSYGLPDTEVTKRLERCSQVLMTKDRGNISFYIYKNKMWLSTYR